MTKDKWGKLSVDVIIDMNIILVMEMNIGI